MSSDQEVKPPSCGVDWQERVLQNRLNARVYAEPPEGWARIEDASELTLNDVKRGQHMIAIDGQWCPVEFCFGLNGYVEITTPPGYPMISGARADLRPQLCRKAPKEERHG